MTETTIVREGEEAFAWAPEYPKKEGWMRCYVSHPDAGGECGRVAVMEVYGLPFCEAHGAEAKAGALEELYHDAGEFFERFDAGHVPAIDNPEALRVLRAGVVELRAACNEADDPAEAALLRAYPVIPERVDSETPAFDYDTAHGVEAPYDWYRRQGHIVHKLMRLAYGEGAVYIVEHLEEIREHVAAQAAFALEDVNRRYGTYEERLAQRQS